jgi:hypothetical protein
MQANEEREYQARDYTQEDKDELERQFQEFTLLQQRMNQQ